MNVLTQETITIEHIDILHYLSTDPIKTTINDYVSNISINLVIQEENQIDVQTFINDHDYLLNSYTYNLSDFSNEIIMYILLVLLFIS